MTELCIGIHVHAEPARLQATLASLQRYTGQTPTLALLPDGPDRPTTQALASLTHLPQLATAQPQGVAACFNRLAAWSDAKLLVLLESGSIVGPGWLDHLLAALAADPSHGLAGPSTNRAWNEQGGFPGAGGTFAEIQRTAQLAHQRFGNAWRTLEPLYSLADFCYAVRREVVAAIGAADERYGLGPCWEMDYNIRAARAGFKGVWACAAYVYRSPFTPRRQQEEARCFVANKHLYQDRFCALRLRGEATAYEPHCRGETCEHFAPPALIQLHLPLAQGEPPKPPASPQRDRLAPAAPNPAPLVSCIMPTGNRTDYVLQSIHYLQRQDYPNWELIIGDDGADDLAARLPQDSRIRYARFGPGLSIGAKRNRACALAHGDVVAQWDDDDWYGPSRLRAQVEPLLAGVADITGLNQTIFFELDQWRFWRCTPELHQKLFVEDVHGGTLVFRRRVWESLAHYPDRSLAEDAFFLRQAMQRGARLARLPAEGLFLYIRHSRNAWRFPCGAYLDPSGWFRIDEPWLPPPDRRFFAARSSMATGASTGSAFDQQPLVSCIMPTADRRLFVPQAIHYFLRQDYPHRELIIVDDGADSVADLVPDDGRVRLIRQQRKYSVGSKRNLACEAARGDIIVHWDDDDWMARRRLSYQVTELLACEADVCGLDRLLYYDPDSRQAWQYTYSGRGKAWVGGNTLCYRKELWRKNAFAETNVGEDTRFLWANGGKRIVRLDDPTFFVGLIHRANVSPKRPGGSYWQHHSPHELRGLMGEDWPFYASMGAGR